MLEHRRRAGVRAPIAMGRAFALAGIFLGYQAADAVCAPASGCDSAWLRAVVPPVVLLGATLAWLRRHPRTVGPYRPDRFFPTLAVALGALIVLFAIVVPAPSDQPAPQAVASLALLTIVPVAEELFFRGLLLDHLRRSLGTSLSVVLVSVPFGLLHGTAPMAVVMTALSLVWCAAALSGRSLLWPIMLHALWNGWAVVHRTSLDHGRIPIACALAGVAGVLAWRSMSRVPREA